MNEAFRLLKILMVFNNVFSIYVMNGIVIIYFINAKSIFTI